mmetsp:Transcript_18444/g.56605  ORF Transcript_18444/g.56605 Transcript_18444/m.56605 type:complete len:178 (+) Transcript_18444:32-565(+)
MASEEAPESSPEPPAPPSFSFGGAAAAPAPSFSFNLEPPPPPSVPDFTAGAAPGKDDDDEDDEQEAVGLLGFRVRVLMSDDDVRALDAEGRQKKPESVEKTLRAKFGDHFERIKGEFEAVARTHAVDDLNRDDGRLAYDLYAAFRPAVPNGRAGWGAPGELDIAKVRGAAKRDEEEP